MIEATGPGKAERPSKQGSKRTRRDEVAEGRLMKGEKRKKAERRPTTVTSGRGGRGGEPANE
jgi:hypothetical protein